MKTLVDHIIWLNLYDISYLINNICIMFEILSKEAFDKNKVQVMVCIDTEDWNINTSVNTPPLSLSKIRRPR